VLAPSACRTCAPAVAPGCTTCSADECYGHTAALMRLHTHPQVHRVGLQFCSVSSWAGALSSSLRGSTPTCAGAEFAIKHGSTVLNKLTGLQMLDKRLYICKRLKRRAA
jgi:hypothetical protein